MKTGSVEPQPKRRLTQWTRSKGIVLLVGLLVLGGTTYAAAALPKNSVGSKQLKKNAVTTKKLKKEAVTAAKVKKNSLTGTQINESTLGMVPSADKLDGLDASAFALAGSSSPPSGAAGGALAGSYPNPSLNVSGGPCSDRQALRDISSLAALTCGPGVYAAGSLTAVPGDTSLTSNIEGQDNSAFGHNALEFNTEGSFNTAVGAYALQDNTTSSGNTATGWSALTDNGAGGGNSAFGSGALLSNTSGNANTAAGATALENNTSGKSNSALGAGALLENTSGEKNTALGQKALFESTGSNNIAIGWNAGGALTSGGNNIYIGTGGGAEESNAIRIGGNQTKAFLAGVSGVTTGGAASPVLVDNNGQLGTTSSSRRFKKDIRPLGSLTKGLMALKPVSFRYKRGYVGGASSLQFGLIAEQVARVYPNLVIYGRDGKPSAVAYQELPALLVAQAQRQQAQIARQRNQISALRTRLRGVDRLRSQVSWLMRQVRRR